MDYFLEAEMRGRRSEMEDAHTHHCGPDSLAATQPCLFGVFDGHGGDECARFLVQNLCPTICSHPMYFDDPVKALEESFVTIDQRYVSLAKQLELEDGSTATVLLLQVDEKLTSVRYYLACTGDSRAILVKKDGSAYCLVEDHNPTREDERSRIKREGGEVLFDVDNQIFRVASETGGGLAVTRAFGDFHFKPYVTALPEVVTGEIDGDDAFICLASDGLWNDLSNKEVGKALIQRGAKNGVEYIISEAFARGSDDNITVTVIDLAMASERLVEEAKTRPVQPTLKRASSRPSSRRLSPASRVVTAADEGAGPHASPLSSPGGRSSIEDPLLVAVARKISTAVHPNLSLTTDVDDIRIPGIPAVFSNDLVLWRDPVASLLWFGIINLMFVLAIFFDMSFLSIISGALLIRFVTTFTAARVATLLNRFGILGPDFQLKVFLARNHILSADTITYFSNAIIGTLSPIVNQWNEMVISGSTTNVLITLRTITYLYTPVPVDVLSWIVFILVFTVPATYARHKDLIDENAKSIFSRVTDFTKPYVDQTKKMMDDFEKWRVRTLSWGKRASSSGDLGAGPPAPRTNKKLGIGHELSEEL